MRNIFTISAILFLFTSCSEDDRVSRDLKIIGTWVSKNTVEEMETRMFYNFKADGTYIFSFTAENLVSRQFLGTKQYEEGTFETENNVLTTLASTSLLTPNGEFVSSNELGEVASGDSSYSYFFENENLLNLTPLCSPTEDCSGLRTYSRVVQEF